MFEPENKKFGPANAFELMSGYLSRPYCYDGMIKEYLQEISDMAEYYKRIYSRLSGNEKSMVKIFLRYFEKVKEIRKMEREKRHSIPCLDYHWYLNC